MKNKNYQYAVFWMAVNAVFGTVLYTNFKILRQDLQVGEIVLYYNFLGLVILGLIRSLFNIEVKFGDSISHIKRAFFTIIGLILFYQSFQYTTIANAIAMTFFDPFVTCVLAAIYFKDRIKNYQILCLVIACIGAIFIIKPGTDVFNYGCILVFFAVIAWGISNIYIKKLADTNNAFSQIFTLYGLSCFFAFIYNIIFESYKVNEFKALESSHMKYILICTAASIINTFALVKAYTSAPFSFVMQFFFLNLISTEIAGYFIFNDTHDFLELIGIAIILTSNYLVFKKSLEQKTQEYLVPNINNTDFTKNKL
jgi:drug/metabolite transporter (DMT)-like permease